MRDCFLRRQIEDGTVFYLNTDGTYELDTTSSDMTVDGNTSLPEEDSYLLQCYSNGYVNKTPLSDLLGLRKNYVYSHGIYTGANLQYCDIGANHDFLIAVFEKDGRKFVTIKTIAALTQHSMLGLKGNYFVKTTFDVIQRWYSLSKELSINVPSIIFLCSRNAYISLDNQDCTNEILWLNSNVFKIGDVESLASEQSPTLVVSEDDKNDVNFDFSSLIGQENENSLRTKFRSYLKSGRNIPIGQGHVKDVLSLCNNKEDFWKSIICLLKCDVKIYRTPIVAYFKGNPSKIYTPDYETLKAVMELIFSINDKIEKNIEFLYPFRVQLTQEDLSVVKGVGEGLSQPEHLHLLGEILNYTPQELIELCLKIASPASYYCIYEVLQKCYKKEGYFMVSKLIGILSPDLENGGIRSKIIRELIYNDFKKNGNNLSSDVLKIKEGGFTEYDKLCHSYEGKKKHKESLDKISTLVGKKVEVKYTKSYQNHHLMTYSGIRVLLPKCMTTDTLTDGCVASVIIAMADKANHTLYATQKTPIDYRKITQTPLLNNGDIIEVTFDINGKPMPHKCYKKVKVYLASIPKDVDYKARYTARVIRQTSDKYHYLVKLV